jgi:pimeloyl-ACP methyl ester carboxylesterase
VHGAAPTLVFVHGWSCRREYWRDQVSHLAGRYRVVTLDLAGHGDSGTGPRAAWTMQSFADDVIAVADVLELRDMVLVGHSMGGDIIVEAARRMPDRVAGLVWVDVYHSLAANEQEAEYDLDHLAEFMAPFRADFAPTVHAFVLKMFGPHADPTVANRVATDMAARPPEIALDVMRHAIPSEPATIAGLRVTAAASVPAVAINGGNPPEVDSLARHGVRTAFVPDVGHFPMLEDPVTVNRLLAEAINGFAAANP